jgi:hypothetical protein
VFVHITQGITDQLNYIIAPSIEQFCSLTPIQLFFDLIGNNQYLLNTYTEEKTPHYEEALSYLSYSELMTITKNLNKYGLLENLEIQ